MRLLLLSDLHHNEIGQRWERAGEEDGRVFTGPLMMNALYEVLQERRSQVDHTLFIGDFTNNGRVEEYYPYKRLLKDFDINNLSLIPGNHDMAIDPLTNLNRAKYRGRFFDHFGRFIPENKIPGSEPFPYIKHIAKDTVLIGIDTTASMSKRFRRTVIGFSPAVGYVGAPQAAAVEKLMSEHIAPGRLIILLLHHDPFSTQNPWTEFADRSRFITIVERASKVAKIVIICGHKHYGTIRRRDENLLHIQAPAFCGRRCASRGLFYDITINPDLSYNLDGEI